MVHLRARPGPLGALRGPDLHRPPAHQAQGGQPGLALRGAAARRTSCDAIRHDGCRGRDAVMDWTEDLAAYAEAFGARGLSHPGHPRSSRTGAGGCCAWPRHSSRRLRRLVRTRPRSSERLWPCRTASPRLNAMRRSQHRQQPAAVQRWPEQENHNTEARPEPGRTVSEAEITTRPPAPGVAIR